MYDLAPSKRTRDDGSRGGLQRRREIFLLLDKDQIAGLCGAKARDTADLRVPVADQDGVHKLRHFFHSTFHASCIAAGFRERKVGNLSAGCPLQSQRAAQNVLADRVRAIAGVILAAALVADCRDRADRIYRVVGRLSQ